MNIKIYVMAFSVHFAVLYFRHTARLKSMLKLNTHIVAIAVTTLQEKWSKLITLNEDLANHKIMYGRFQCKSCDVNFVDENSLENTLKNSILLGVNTLIKSLAIKIVLISMYLKLMLPITKKNWQRLQHLYYNV